MEEVVPHAGTWIEIQGYEPCEIPLLSFPTRERGLKSHELKTIEVDTVVPHAGTWIEITKTKTFVGDIRRSPRVIAI